MKRFIKNYTSYMRNEAGLTLVELLASITIFILILIPLSSVYVSGITTYGKTQVQTSLRNEADFIIGDIMDKLQNASYFDLDDGTDNTDKSDIFNVLKSGHVVTEANDTAFKKGVAVYTREVNYEKLNESSLEKVPVSILKKKAYQFSPTPPGKEDLYAPFSYDDSYLVYALFRIIEENSDKNNKRVGIYLIIAPKKQNNDIIQNGQKTAFSNLAEIKAEVERLQSAQGTETATAESNVLFNYIYMVRTELSVNSLSQE